MICISVSPESRKFAKVDLFNAAGQCDLIELCLDRLIKPPDMRDLLDGVTKPVLVSCRRRMDGGHWTGDEEERLTLLRQAIVAGPAYVELDLDIAKSIPRFGDTKRVVAYANLRKPLTNVDKHFEDATSVNADVVKFTSLTPTLDAAWPLLAAVSKKRKLPVVGMGLGRAGITFSLLGQKYGSPWLYAALEKGMEAYEGQPTVRELDELYGWRDIGPNTRFIGVAGAGATQTTAIRLFNSGFRAAGLNTSCLPLEIGAHEKLPQMLDILKINAIIVNPELSTTILPLAQHYDEVTAASQYADLLLKLPDGWHAYNTLWRSALRMLEEALGKSSPDERPLDRRNVLILGAGELARALIHGIERRKGLVSVACPDEKAAKALAQATGVRLIPMNSLYDTLADVVINTDRNLEVGPGRTQINPSYLRPPMTFMDVSRLPLETSLYQEAKQRGLKVVSPAEIGEDQITAQFKSITGKDFPGTVVPDELTAD
jgi:3-dehydroquinate dehydratase / shikimate dehydrogenase